MTWFGKLKLLAVVLTATVIGGVASAGELEDFVSRLTRGSSCHDGFVRIADRSFGFPWLKIRCDAKNRKDALLCEAWMAYAAAGASSVPVRRLKSLEERMRRELKLDVVSQTDDANGYRAELQSKECRFVLDVRKKSAGDG